MKFKMSGFEHDSNEVDLSKYNKEEKAMRFTLNGVTYERNEKGNRFFKTTDKTDAKGNPFKVRIGEAVFEKAWDEFKNQEMDEAEEEKKARQDLQDKSDKGAEDAVNHKAVKDELKKEPKKAAKPRKSKDIAVTVVSGTGYEYTITARQADFIKHLPDTGFYEDGLDSVLWCDCLADDIQGQFAGKPMTVGAMISTLREKGLIEVGRDDGRKGKPKFMKLTVLGKEFAKKLGLH